MLAPEGGIRTSARERWLAVVIVAVASWPVHARSEPLGLDPGWRAGLALAAKRGLDYGPDIVYVYGPLGFLTRPDPPYWRGAWLLGLVYTVLLQVATVAALYWAARRRLQPVPAAVAAYVLTVIAGFAGPEQIQIPVVIAAIAIIRNELSPTLARRLIPCLGVAGGVAILGKLNGGIGVVAFALVACLCLDERVRATAVLGGVTAATVLAGWLASGNRLGDLPNWVAACREIFGGYSSANQIEVRAALFHYGLLPFVSVAFAWLVVAELRRDQSRSQRVALALVAAFFAFSTFKHGFVRHSVSNGTGFFALLATFAVPLVGWGRLRLTHVVAYAVLVCCAIVSAHGSIADAASPVPHLRSLTRDALDVAVPGRQGDAVARWRAERRDQYKLEPSIVGALAGHNFHIDPLDAGVAWAYPEFEWNPLPIFQIFTAYTADLDDRNADRLRDDERAPERILRPNRATDIESGGSVDGRIPEFDSPEANFEMLCRYRVEAASARWQVLARAANRCGPPVALSRVAAQLGQVVAVPAPSGPNRVVVGRVRELGGGPAEAALALAYKASEFQIQVANAPFPNRIVPATAAGPLVLRGGGAFGLGAGFGFDHDIASFTITTHNSLGLAPSSYTIEFFEVEVGR